MLMQITIYISTKKLLPFYQDLIEEYKKRLQRDCKLEYKLLSADSYIDFSSIKNSYSISVVSQKSTTSSEEFANLIQSLSVNGFSSFSFFVGFPPNSNHILSITPLSISSDLLGTLLVEQIYRAFRILSNAPYHK